MIELDIKLNNIDAVMAKLNPKVFKKAFNRTINDLGSKAKTQMVKDVRKAYNIRAAKLKQHMKVKRSKYDDMRYIMDIQSRRRNVMNFAAKKLKARGKVSVKIRKETGRATLRHSFVAKNGAILHRVGKTQEIKGVITLSIPQMFNNKIVENEANKLKAEFRNKLKNNLNFYIGKE